MAGAASARTTGFHRTATGLGIYFNGVLLGTSTTTALDLPIEATGALAATTSLAGGSLVATTTLTAGTGLTVTTGNLTDSAGDVRNTAGNLRLGAISTFAMTEPTSAVVMKVGTNPEGAIATSGGFFVTTGGATISKIIADGTVTQIEA